MNTLEKRYKVLSVKRDECKDEALKARRTGDNNNALKWMRKVKTIEKDLAKIDGQQSMLEQQNAVREGLVSDVGVIGVIKSVAVTINTRQKEAKD